MISQDFQFKMEGVVVGYCGLEGVVEALMSVA
jgi:hypothetical protein